MNPTSFSPLTRLTILLFSQRPMASPRSSPPPRSQTESLLSTKPCPTRCRGSNVEPNCQFMISGHSLAQSVHSLAYILFTKTSPDVHKHTHTRIHAVKIIFITKKDYLTTSFNLSGSYKKQSIFPSMELFSHLFTSLQLKAKSHPRCGPQYHTVIYFFLTFF